ncbi:MAG: hypothetical protein ACYCPT_11345 [Acidimicrobiales bacterium]
MSDHTPSGPGRPTRPASTRRVAAKEVTGPLHWPTLTPLDAEREWPALRAWVTGLRERYDELDFHYVPACWFMHPAIVSCLQGLRDHEKMSYDPSSPASAGTEWHRAFRDMVALLRTFTSNLRCTNTEHFASRPTPSVDDKLFDEFVAEDIARRRREAIDRALGDGVTDPE